MPYVTNYKMTCVQDGQILFPCGGFQENVFVVHSDKNAYVQFSLIAYILFNIFIVDHFRSIECFSAVICYFSLPRVGLKDVVLPQRFTAASLFDVPFNQEYLSEFVSR
jgi:hypothetical protein